jgi:hypothetical protein
MNSQENSKTIVLEKAEAMGEAGMQLSGRALTSHA